MRAAGSALAWAFIGAMVAGSIGAFNHNIWPSLIAGASIGICVGVWGSLASRNQTPRL